MKKLLLSLFAFLSITFSAHSQAGVPIHWTESIENCTQNAPNQLEFDLFLQFDGTIPNIELLAYSAGVNYNASILNGGNGSFIQVAPRDAALSPLSAVTIAHTNGNISNGGLAPNHLRFTQSPRTAGSGVLNVNPAAPSPSPQFLLGRFRLTTSASSLPAMPLPVFHRNAPHSLEEQTWQSFMMLVAFYRSILPLHFLPHHLSLP